MMSFPETYSSNFARRVENQVSAYNAEISFIENDCKKLLRGALVRLKYGKYSGRLGVVSAVAVCDTRVRCLVNIYSKRSPDVFLDSDPETRTFWDLDKLTIVAPPST